MHKIPVGISSCLLGQEVRYDGAHKHNTYIEQTLGQFFEFKAFCPEVASGLGIPRPPVQLRLLADGIHCVGVKNPEWDVTAQLQAVSIEQEHWLTELCAYILKKDSPSCGMTRVKVYQHEQPVRNGTGIFARYLQQRFPELPIEEEGRLGDPVLRENFVQRVFVFSRWREMVSKGLTAHALMIFHSRHKLIAMSHDQLLAKELGRLVANTRTETLDEDAENYLQLLMKCLKISATRSNHVNVLQHIQGYLKKHLDSDDKRELIETIERYRLQQLPLVVPLTLLRHHFRRQPNEFIDNSYYLQPPPGELALLNTI